MYVSIAYDASMTLAVTLPRSWSYDSTSSAIFCSINSQLNHTLKNCCWHLLCQDFLFLSAFLCGNKNVFKAWQVALWPLHCNWLWLLRFPAATSRGTKAAHLKPLTNHPRDKYCKNASHHLENFSKKVNSLTPTASPKFWILQKKNSSLRCNQQLENSTRHLHHLHPFFKAISQHRSF